MEIATLAIPYRSRTAHFHLYFLGDVHLGSAMCDEGHLQATLDAIRADPLARVFLMGDLGEFIPRGEWRFHEETVAAWVDRTDVAQSEKDSILERLSPLAKQRKVLGAIQGNHEMELADTWNQNIHKQICEELGIRNLGYMALVRLLFHWDRKGTTEAHKLDIFLHHGFGGGRSDGADLNRFSEYQRDYNCDWFIAGHTHRRMAIPSVQHYITDGGKLGSRIRYAGRSGTFLRTVVEGKFGYPEKTALRPLATGALMLTYNPASGDAVANV